MESIPTRVERLWVEWDVRLLVLLSLALQILLIILGSRRKYTTGVWSVWIRIIVWSAYMLADWVATVALGRLSHIVNSEAADCNNKCNSGFGDQNNGSRNERNAIRVLWAPLLLLHLGGPDTITAYSMEDKQLWLRHALGLVVQACVVIYIFLRSWIGSWMPVVAFPLFIAGIIKYGERVWVLWLTNKEKSKERESMKIHKDHNLRYILGGYSKFRTFKPHIPHYVCSFDEMEEVEPFSPDATRDAFKVIEFELDFMYDVLYTKAAIIYTKQGGILRSISFFCTVSVLLGFSAMVKNEYSSVDVFISYLLLIGAVVLDIYSATLMLFSNWAILWLSKYEENPYIARILGVLVPLSLNKWKRWSDSMAQLDLMGFCLHGRKSSLFHRILGVFGMYGKFKEYRCQTRVKITREMKKLIGEQIVQITEEFDEPQPLKTRGELALDRHKHLDLKWSIQADFDKSIIVWHIATDICYYSDDNPENKTFKQVSDYMMYLLVQHPYMLSITTWHFMFRHTCNSIITKFKKKELKNKAKACEAFLSDEFLDKEEKDDEEEQDDSVAPLRSAIVDARILATNLMTMPDRWNIISDVWIEMLFYAAFHCQPNYHAQQLRRGGEFLSHVWLLLSHIRLTEKLYKMAQRTGKSPCGDP